MSIAELEMDLTRELLNCNFNAAARATTRLIRAVVDDRACKSRIPQAVGDVPEWCVDVAHENLMAGGVCVTRRDLIVAVQSQRIYEAAKAEIDSERAARLAAELAAKTMEGVAKVGADMLAAERADRQRTMDAHLLFEAHRELSGEWVARRRGILDAPEAGRGLTVHDAVRAAYDKWRRQESING
jgi:hypothetical protein